MRRLGRFRRSLAAPFALAAFAVLPAFATLPAFAASPPDPLRLVPADAAVVGVLHIADLRSSPLAAKVFGDMDKITVDGDAARFLAETHLRPIEDVDRVVFAASPGPAGKGRDGRALVAFEGRFEPDKLAAALASRGALLQKASGGDYYRLKDDEHADHPDHPDHHGAVALLSPQLVLAGSEAAVVEALAARLGGGTSFLSGSGLGRQMSRIASSSTGWLLVDRSRFPQLDKVNIRTEGDNPIGGLVMAVKSVSAFAFQMTAKGDALQLSATGVAADDETRDLLEDAMRGILAAWRLASQDRPEVVSVLRRFKVSRDGDGVTVAGTLPGEVVRAIAQKRTEQRAAKKAQQE